MPWRRHSARQCTSGMKHTQTFLRSHNVVLQDCIVLEPQKRFASILTCCSWRFLRPILCVFQACLGSPATSSHCSHTPKFALKKASFCLPLRRSCRNLSSAAADLNPTQPPYHCRKAFKAGMLLNHTLVHQRQLFDVMTKPITCCKHE
jgi:hypothetical protein